MTNITLLSQVKSMFKLDSKGQATSVMPNSFFSLFIKALKNKKGVFAVLLPMFVALTAASVPVIQTQPSQGSAEVCVTSAGSLTVVATAGGGGTVSYQWQRVARSGATLPADTTSGSSAWANITSGYSGTYSAPTLLIPAGDPPLADFYRCVLVETGGSSPGTRITRSGNLLVVSGVPTFSVTPSSATICEGSANTFFVTVNGPAVNPHTVNYQWQTQEGGAGAFINGNSTGSTTSAHFTANTLVQTNSFTFNAAVMADDDIDQIRVNVTNVCGTSTAGPATLTVDPIPNVTITTSNPQNICQTGSVTPAISVTNALLSARRASAAVNWTVNYTYYDGVANTTTPLSVSNTGNVADVLFTLGAASAAGCYIWDIQTITNTSSGATPQCFRNISAQLQANVYPNPVVSFTAGPVDVCEGNTASFTLTVSNATYLCNSSTTSIPWSGTYASQSQEGGAVSSFISSAFSGSGNGTFTYTTSALTNDDYRVALTAFATTGVACPTSTALPIFKQIRSFPTPSANMSGSSTQNTCENGTITIPSINVTNAVWNGPGAVSTNMDWSLAGSDPTGNVAFPLTGSGNVTAFVSASPAAPAAGCHIIKLNSIALTNTAGATPNPPVHPLCSQTISGQQKTFNVYPNPVVSFTADPVDVCEGSAATFTLTVSNSTWTCNSVTSNIPWSGTFNSQLQEGGAAAFSITPSTTGTGNGTTTFTTSALLNNDYRVELASFASTSGASCAASTALPIYKQLRSFPIPDATMSTTPVSLCESGSITTPAINVTNAVWLGPGAASTNMNHSLSITDGTGLLGAGPLNGTGNMTHGAVGPTGGFAPACYTLTLNSIQLTSTAGATPNPPVHPNCPATLIGQSKTWTVNPEPVLALSPVGPSPSNRVNLCEGSSGSWGLTVTNAVGCTGPQSWGSIGFTETFEGAANGSAAVGSTTLVTAASATIGGTNSGNQSYTIPIPGTYAPGQYMFTVSSISTGSCAGTIAANAGTIYINVYPKPTIAVSPNDETVCEGTSGNVTFTVNNTYFDPASNAPISGNLPGHFTYTTTGGPMGGAVPSTPVTYGGSTTSIVLGPYATSNTLTAGTYTLTADNIYVDNPSCAYALSPSATYTYTLTVKKTPLLTINSVTSKTCLGNTATINYTVSNIDAGVSWSFTYSSTGFAGVQTVTGTGPVTGATTTTPAYTATGTHNLVFTGALVTSGSAPFCLGAAPANVPVTVIPLPQITALTATTSSTFCSGSTMSFDATVTNMVVGLTTYSWTITYNVVQTAPGAMTISTGHTASGTGNGTFNFTIPGTQRHFLANGDASSRQIVITKIEHTSSSPGGEPLCERTTGFTAGTLNFTVEPMPRINITPLSQNVCVTSQGTVNYTITGVRAGKTWSFKWHNDNPSIAPIPVSGSGSGSGGGSGSFLTNALTNPGFAGIYITDLASTTITCDSTSTYDDTTRFIVNPASYADTLTPNYIVCEDNNSNIIRVRHPNLLVGLIQGWDSSHDNGFTWRQFTTTPPGTDSVNTFNNIRYTTQYRIRVKSGACPVAYSTVAQIFIDPRPKIQIVDNNLTVCSGGNVVLTVLVSGVKSTETWSASFTHTGTPTWSGPLSGTGSGTFTFTVATGVTSGTHTVVINSITNGITGCVNYPAMSSPTNTFTASVASASVAGNIYLNTITAGTILPQTVCEASTITLRHGDHGGSVSPTTTWFWSTASSPTYPADFDSTVNNSSSLVVNTSSFPPTTKYMVRVKSGSCNSVRSGVFNLNVRDLPTASFDAPRYKRICEGSSVGNAVTVNGSASLPYSIGYIVGGTNSTLTGTTNGSGVDNPTLLTPMLGTSTNVIMNSIAYTTAPACTQQLYTDAVSEMVVLNNPRFQMVSVDTPICVGNTTNYTYNIFNISNPSNLTGVTTTIDALEDGSSSVTGTSLSFTASGNGAATRTTGAALSTAATSRFISLTKGTSVYSFSTAPTSVTCDTAYNSNKSFKVWPSTTAGTLSGTATVCKGSNSGSVVQATPGNAVIIRWEASTDGGSTWTNISNTSTTQTYSNITTTTQFRAIYKAGNCAEAASSAVTITVNELPTLSIARTGNANICSGSAGTYDLTVGNTYGLAWSAVVMEGGASRTITGTGNGTFSQTTTSTFTSDFTVSLVSIQVTGTPTCGPNSQSGTVSYVVTPNPSVTLNSVTSPVCAGASTFASFQITTSNIASGVGFSVTYSVGATTGLTYTNTGSGTFTVVTTTPALSTAGSTAVTLTGVTTTGLATNCSSTPSGATMNITVDAVSTAGTTSSNATVCKGANSGTVSVASHNGSVVRWEFLTTGSSTWTTVSNTTTSITYSNLTATTKFRAVTKNGSCSEINSSEVTITVNEQPTATISITGTNGTICANTSGTYRVTTANTYGQNWTLNVVEGSSARALTGTGDGNFDFTTIATLPSNGSVSLVNIATTSGVSCGPNTVSGSVTFTVTPLPMVTLNSVSSPLCMGASTFASFSITTSNIASGVGFDVTYSIGATSGLHYTNTGSGTFNITTTTPALSTAGTYTVALTNITTTGLTTNCNTTPTSPTRDIIVDATSVQGTASPVTVSVVCKGSNSGSVLVSGHNGSVVRWEYLPSGSSTWTTVSNTSTTLAFSNLTVTTQFRAVTKNGSCNEINSVATTITVRDLPTATISGSKTICAGTTTTITGAVTVSNTFSNPWEISYLEGTTSKTMTGTGDGSFDITTSVLNTNTDITLQSITMTQTATNTNPVCGPTSLSGTITVNVNALPTVTLNSVGGPICQGSSTTFTITVSNVPTGNGWNVTGTIDGVSMSTVSGTGSGTFTFNTQTLNTAGSIPVVITLITNTTTTCTSGAISLSKNITVDATSIAGTASPSTVSVVCKGANSGDVVVSGHNGTVVRWEYLPSGSSTWTTVSNTTTTLTFTNLTVTTQFRAVTRNGACSEINSSATTITVRDLPTASISGSKTICAETSTTITGAVTVSNTFSNPWSISYLEGTTSKTLTGTGDGNFDITTNVLTTNTDITLQSITMTQTASNTNPVCGPTSLSSTITVNVNVLPSVTLNSVGGPICSGSSTNYTVTVSNVPAGQGWSLTGTIDNGTSVVAISSAAGTGSGTFTFNTPTLTNTTSTSVGLPVTLTLITNTTTGCTSGTISLSRSITVFRATVGGTAAPVSVSTVCKGSNNGDVSVSGHIGSVVRWEYLPAGSSTWTSVSNTTSTLTFTNLTVTTSFRAVIMNGPCSEANSASTTITVRDLPTATITSSPATICAGLTHTYTITVANTFSNPWSIALLEGATNRTVTGTGDGAFSFTTGALTSNTDVTLKTITMTQTASNTNPVCGPSTLSSTVTVNINSLPTVTLNSVGGPICQGSATTFSITVSNVLSGQGWTVTGTIDGVAMSGVSGTGSGTFTFNTQTLNTPGSIPVVITLITNTTTTCNSGTLSLSRNITVDATSVAGTASPSTVSVVCKGSNSGDVVVSGHNGTVVRWEYLPAGSSTWTTVSNTTTTLTFTNLTVTTQYRAVTRNGACSEINSSATTITVRDLPTATISGSKTICAGTSTTITGAVTVSNTYSNPWSISYLEGTTSKTLTGTGDGNFDITTSVLNTKTDITLQSITMTQTASNTNPVCGPTSLSSTITVDVNPLPTVTLNSVGGPICQGSATTFSITVSNVPTGQGWNVTGTIDGVSMASVSGTGSGTFTFNTQTLNTPGSIPVIISLITNTTTSCTSGALSLTRNITVDATTVAGSLTGTATVCKGANSGTISYSGGNGSIVRWEYSINGGTTWSSTGTSASTYSYSNLTQTTDYRVTVKNGACLEAISGSLTITVNELPFATINGSKTKCQNDTANLNVVVSNTFGNPWELTFLEGTTTRTLTGTGNGSFKLATNALSSTTDITLVSISLTHSGTSSNPACSQSGLSSTATVSITPLPTATLNSVNTPICVNNSSSFQFTVSNVATGQGWSMNYTEGGTSKTTTGNGPGTYTVATSTLTTAGTVTITLNSISTTSLSPNCTRTLTGQTMDITVNATTTVGTLGTDVTVCKNANSGTLTYNVGSSNGAVVRWESSVNGGASWTAISNTSNSHTYSNISQTTLFRVWVKNGICAEDKSNTVTVTVQEIPVATIGGSTTICAGNTSTLSISISNVAAGQRSILTYLEGTTTKTVNIFGASGSITTSVLNTNTDITLVSVTSIDTTISSVFRKGCANSALTSTATVNVNALPTVTLTSVGGPICQGNSTTFTVTVTNVPTGQGWNLTGTIEGNPFSPTPSGTGSGTFTFNTPVLNTPTSANVTITKITNTTTSCERTVSESRNITVDATTTVGTTSGSAVVCKGSNAGSVSYIAGSTNGAIVRWEYSTVSPSTNYNGITNTSATQTYSNLTATTYYRAIVKNGVCAEVASSVETITVRELPNATISGNATICEGSSTNFTITVSNTFGQTFRLYYLIGSKLDSLEKTGDGTYTISTGVLTSTTTITLLSIKQISGTPQCSQTLTGTITITVNELPRASFTSVPTSLCQGSAIQFTFDVSKVKTTQNWTMVFNVKAPSSSSGSNQSTTGSGSGTYSVTSSTTVLPTTTTLALATITNNSTGCSSTLTETKVINVDATTVGGTVSSSATVCSGSNSGTLSLTGNTGSVVRWESSVNGGSTWSSITNTSSTLTYSNITQTTVYRAVVMNGVCLSANSTSVTITVNELPTASVTSTTICAGTTAGLTVTVGNTYGASWTLTFVEGSTTRTLSGTGNGSFTLTTNVLTSTTTIALKSIVITTGTVTCSNTLTGVGTVTVNDLPTVTHNTMPASVCDGSPVDFTVSVSDVGTSQNWTVSYNIAGGGTITRSGTGPGVFTITTPNFANSSTTMRVDNINLTSIVNNTTGCSRTATLTRTIEVYPKSVGGTTSATLNTLCANSATSTDITVTGFVGKIVRWEYSDDNQLTWTTYSNTASTITVNNLSSTREYRAVVLSGPCNPANSSITRIVVIPTVEAEISGAPSICAGKTATFNVLVSKIASTDNWSLTYRVNGILQTAMTGKGPGNYPLSVGAPTTNTAGTIVVKLETITNTTFNCANNNLASQAMATVNPNPSANFTFANSCKDSVAVFNNTSTISSGTIASYMWNFADGSLSKDGNPTHAYTATGNYPVSLLAISNNGCRDSITKTITVNPRPTANFSFKNTCQDTAVKFTDGSSIAAGGSIASYFWQFGDGSTSSLRNPSHQYGVAGNYTVTLTVVSNNGCAAVISQTVTVYDLPEPNYVAAPVCENSAMTFVNTSSLGAGTMSYRWDFAGQGNSTLTNPTHTFTGFGSFNVTLTATSGKGCVKTLVKPVTVWANPIANFTVADVCIGEVSRFANTSAMPGASTDKIIENYWSFGDSTFSTGKDPMHKYAKVGIFSVTVRATSDKGCVNSVTKAAVVHALPVVTITTPKPKFCEGDKSVLRGSAGMRQYEWSLNGTVVGTADSVTVTKQGWYKLKIWAPTALGGCTNEDSIFITVWPLPVADAGNDTIIDKGQSVILNGRGAGLGGSYAWAPSTYLNNPSIARPTSKPDETILYVLTVTDRNGCVDTDSVKITVQAEFVLKVHNVITPNADGFNDTWIIDNIEAYPTAEVAIFNRYGMEVFKTKGYANQWDGTDKLEKGNDLPDGAYYYVITLEGNTKVYTGSISLVRSQVK